MHKQKAIYILGGGILGTNIIKWAKEIGLYTIVTDKNKDAPGLVIADTAIVADTTNANEHLKHIEQLSNNYNIVGAYCGIELGLWTLYYIHKKLNISYISEESIEIVLDKVKMKKIWQNNDLSTPKANVINNHEALISFIGDQECKFVIKPSLGSGSRGVQIVDKTSNLVESFTESLNSVNNKGQIIIEEYIQGRSIDVNGIFIENQFYPAGVLEKYETSFPDCLPLGGNDPADISNSEEKEVYRLFEQGCRLLGITHGPVKGDLIRNNNGKYYLLEVSPRMHGDVTTSNTIPYGLKINPIKFYFKYLKDRILDEKLIDTNNRKYATWRVICLPPGEIKSHADKNSHISQITKIWHNPKCNTKIKKYTNTALIPGYICAYGDNQKEAEKVLEDYFLNNRTNVIIDKQYKKWYKQLGKQLEKHGFSKISCGYQENKMKE